MIGNLCIRPEGGVDVAMYHALHTTLSLDEAYDLAEIDAVSRSWREAAEANIAEKQAKAKARAAAARARRKAGG